MKRVFIFGEGISDHSGRIKKQRLFDRTTVVFLYSSFLSAAVAEEAGHLLLRL